MTQRIISWTHRFRPVLALLGALVLLVGGCHTARDGKDEASKDAKVTDAVQAGTGAASKAKILDETPIMVNQVAPDKAGGKGSTLPARAAAATVPTVPMVTPGTGAAVSGTAPATLVPEYPGSLVKGIKDPDAKVKVLFNFDAAPLTEAVPLFGALLNFNYLIDPAVKGSVTMTVDSEMTAREVWAMFEEILWLSGAYASRNPGYVHVLPLAKMPQERRLLGRFEPSANVAVALLPVYRAKSADLATALAPFKSEGATITDFPRLNSLLVVDSPVNMEKLRGLTALLDGTGETGWPQICVRCQKVDAASVRDELMTLLPVIGLPVTDKASSGGEIKITALPRLQAIIVSAALPEVLAEVERWIKALDQENEAEQENVFFYNVRHSTADHLLEALGVFFNTNGLSSTTETTKSTSSKAGGSGSSSGLGGSFSSSSSSGRNRQSGSTSYSGTGGSSSRQGRAVSGLSATSSGQSGDSAAPKTVFDTPVTLYADNDQNRLTIRTTPRAYAMVEALLKRLDVPSRQVLIQAVIAEIVLDKSTEYGFAMAAKTTVNGEDTRYLYNGLPSGVNPFSLTQTDTALPPVLNTADARLATGRGFALSFGNTNSNVMGYITAVAGRDNVRVVSAPQIMASNDQEAMINVGEEVPIRTGDDGSTTSTSTSGSSYPYSTNSYSYMDTGIKLTVTPHITAGNVVKMDVHQEVSDAVQTTTSKIDSPTKQNRELETQLVVPDGGTVLMGGLIRNKQVDNRSGVPLLMDIPWLGVLFRSNSTSNRRTELLVVITATVVDESSDVDQLASRYRAAVHEMREQMKK
ncbi:MAG: type II secretion system secretin GspD [Lentisphaeria bacterium]